MRKATLALLFLCACDGSIVTPPPPAPGTLPGEPLPADPMPSPPLACNDRKHGASTELKRLTPAQYRNAIADIFEKRVSPSERWPGTYGASATGYSTEPALGVIGEQGADQLMAAAEDVALAVAPVLPQLLQCSTSPTAGTACLGTWLDTFARRAFRRALTPAERAALTTTYQAAKTDGASFTEAIAIATAQLLQSPQFLYLAEGTAGAGRALTGDELATRLSFMLWDTVPDDALLAKAAQLTDAAVLAAEAERMLQSPKADTALARLLREWTQTSALTASDKDSAVFPFFDPGYAASLNVSFDLFAAAQLRGGTLSSLLTTTDAYVDAKLAPGYGVTAPPAGQWAKVALDGTRYAGVATQGLVLASDAHANDASFVLRGRFVRRRLLCNAFGPPPADAQAQFSSIPLPQDPTGKEVSAAVLERNACKGCHTLLNPAGLSLEHFDGAGRWREAYGSGRAIDPSGALPQVDGKSLTFSSHVDLLQQLAQSKDLESCAARQLFRFTFSRLETAEDACAVQAVQTALGNSGGELPKALLALVATDAFSWRVDP